jgi:hypothetical protein
MKVSLKSLSFEQNLVNVTLLIAAAELLSPLSNYLSTAFTRLNDYEAENLRTEKHTKSTNFEPESAPDEIS